MRQQEAPIRGWNPNQYLKFSGHRLRPALDLLLRIPDFSARTVADLGAGAGNVTKLLKERWPDAEVAAVEARPKWSRPAERPRLTSTGSRPISARGTRPRNTTSFIPTPRCTGSGARQAVPEADRVRRARRHPRGADAAQFRRAIAHLITETALDGPWRSKAGAAAEAVAGAGPAFYYGLLAPQPAPRHLGDRVSAGADGRQPGQGMDQGHLADALLASSRSPSEPRSRPPMASASRRPIRRRRTAKRCSRSAACS